ncbi:MAG: homospermidine synthase [Proteobacteria bacterium]|nr:homospermidine synthase [Pseudomonadota bacterium]
MTAPKTTEKIHVEFPGRIVMVGCGSIGQGVLPLILRHIGIAKERINIIAADERGRVAADSVGVKFIKQALTPDNHRSVLEPLLGRGDFLLNVSVDVSSIALIRFCWERGAMYLDTCIEPWPGGYTDPSIPHSRRTNYALREAAMALRKEANDKTPTTIITHGANPGLVSHFIKQALVNIAADLGVQTQIPGTRAGWAVLAQSLGIKTIHIAERDTQNAVKPKMVDEFVNTWSVDGFVSEGMQPAELGWGTNERNFPVDGRRHDFGSGAGIFLMQPGAATRVRTWTPKAGHIHGFLITHSEAISTADFYTVMDQNKVAYRPTCHYSYHPCDSAVVSLHEFVGKNYHLQSKQRILMDEILDGIDELGVLLAGHKRNAYWYGSQLSIDEARKLAPFNNATSLQVTAACLSGMVSAMENPHRGLLEPEDLDFGRNLEICKPYLGPVVGKYTDWTPLHDRERLFPEDLDKSDPWQFKNVRVVG